MRRAFFLLPLTLLVLAGCVTDRAPRIEPAPKPEPAVMPTLPEVPPPDLSSLAGRRVVVDPGHGGPWPGAVAPHNGLKESDVNLRVSLHLARLIDGAGGEAILTRTADAALDPSGMSKDLSARAAVANREGADVFISVHHNADIATGSDRNALEVYYKLGEDGASLDVAQALTYDLARRLRADAEAKLLLPGNYKVLREARVPAVLLESSYLTHAGNAAFLATEPAVQAEALAIAAGLAEYFRSDPPRVVSARFVEPEGPTPRIEAHFASTAPLDPASVEVLHDGQPLPGRAEAVGGVLQWISAEPLPNGPYAFEVRARNARGAAVTFSVEGRVSRAPAALVVSQRPDGPLPGESTAEALFEVRAVDAFGFPVAEGTVTLAQPSRTADIRDGAARFYVPVAELPPVLAFRAGTAAASWPVETGSTPFRSIRVTDARTRAPVEGASLLAGGKPVAVTTSEGWAAVPGSETALTVVRAGYEPASVPATGDAATVALTPRHGGVLHGKRIVLDPAYGGRAAGAIGPRGTRAGDVNLDVALRAARILREAGADVTLTRTRDVEIAEPQRVAAAEESGVEIYVSVSFGAPGSVNRALDATGHLREDLGAFVGHYPGSAAGTRLARAIAARLGVGNVAPSVSYVVQQVSAPAVLVQPATVEAPEAEERYRTVEARQQIAEALSAALVDFYAQPAK